MKRGQNPGKAKAPPPAPNPPRRKPPATEQSSQGDNWLMGLSSFAILLATVFLVYAVRLYLIDSKAGHGANRFIQKIKKEFVNPEAQFANLRFFERLNRVLDNETFHGEVVQAIANLSFIPFIAEHAERLAADCAAGWSHDLIHKSMEFLLNYTSRENVSACFANLSRAVLIGCRTFKDVTVEVLNFVVNNSNQIGEGCLADHLERIVVAGNESTTLSGWTTLLSFFAQAEFPVDPESPICAAAQAAVDRIDEWEDTTKQAVCGLAQKVHCLAFDALDLVSLCPGSDT
jgi:hypothetical protein